MHYLKKRGLSQIIATMLIISLVLVAVGIITPIIIKIARDNLEKGSCYHVRDQITISREDYAYSCYDGSTNTINVTIRVGDINLADAEVTKLYIAIEGENIKREILPSEFPGGGEEKTYIIDLNKPEYATSLNLPLPKVQIYPEVNGKKCAVIDSIGLKNGCT